MVASAARALQHMQKVLTEMNIKLHHVFSDLDGVSAMRIVDAILAGERDAAKLWLLRDKRSRVTRKDFLAAMEGDWRDEYLFVLRQCLERWRSIQEQIAQSDGEIEKLMVAVQCGSDGAGDGRGAATKRKQRRKNDLNFDVHEQAQRFYGVDLATADGVGAATVAVLMSELGTGEQILRAFRSDAAFGSWLGLCPDNRISGGRILSSKTRKVNHRVARALRLAAYGLGNAKSELGIYCRRMKARLGKAEGITATAHKLARIIYAMIRTREPYDEKKAFAKSPQSERKRLKSLKHQAAKLGFELVPQQSVA